eukprot:gnl/TRDRNA2_/TRDRNA2_82016_c0_seq1.p1 gnl/TRDRNA2_/TRDRNA2_82016_c0~~gnl/TRDRNA2_/TRDRNA2_82016_c0_seq1.p1  ORF type:complete len:141 (-),score=34.59 gnl/TRDRNA2_/TRDRNA2_82016_c0_seq1:400-822(-)
MKVTDAVQSRRTWRGFHDRPVPLDVVRELLETSARAPSGGNTQPWHLYVLTGSKLEALKKAMVASMMKKAKPRTEYETYPAKQNMPKELFDVWMQRRIKVAEQLWEAMGVKREDKAGRAMALMKNWEFWGAPVAWSWWAS